MDSNVWRAVLALSVVISAAVLYAAIVFAIVWIAVKALPRFIKKVPEYHWAQKRNLAIRDEVRAWRKRNQAEIERLWEHISEIYLDPLFFAYAVFVLFNRIAAISDYTKTHPEYDFWQVLTADMERDMNFYAWFLMIFFVWALSKAWRHRQRLREQRALTKAIEANAQILQAIAKKLDVSPGDTRSEREQQ